MSGKSHCGACDRDRSLIIVILSDNNSLESIVERVQPVHELPEAWQGLIFDKEASKEREGGRN
jgi:hypothetical protein